MSMMNESFNVQCITVDNHVWFRGRDVATILEYQNTTKAIIDHVDEMIRRS